MPYIAFFDTQTGMPGTETDHVVRDYELFTAIDGLRDFLASTTKPCDVFELKRVSVKPVVETRREVVGYELA